MSSRPSPLTLFDANGSFGYKCRGTIEFATPRERLAHMDRLGITRAIVWNTEAATDNVTATNQSLRDQIERLNPPLRRRLVPAFTISPLLQYERGGLDALHRNLAECRPSCLHFTAGLTGFKLLQLDPLMRSLKSFRPVIIMNHAQTDERDILEFTELFPKTRLVLTSAMWPQQLYVMSLMRRRKNIMVETSLFHTWSAIEQLVRHFGADCVVLGLGHKSHNGAAIAALAQAEISSADRALIAHGNLDRLLGVRTEPLQMNAAGQGKNILWRRLLARRALGVDVVDAHAHLGGSGGYVLEENDIEKQVPLTLAAMRRIGVNTMIVSGMQALLGNCVKGNDLLAKLLAPHAGKLQGYVSFNPVAARQLLPRLDRYFASGVFVGFKLLCDYWQISVQDKRFEPVWDYANRHRLPILLHTWDGNYDSPGLLKDIVRRYPEASFLLGHSGGGDKGRAEAVALAVENTNVHLEWCGSFCNQSAWEETLKKVNARQVVFGTDAFCHGIPWELGRLLSLDVPAKAMRPILGANMRRILDRRKR